MARFGLIMPFLNESVDFALGVEFGILYARMRDGGEEAIEGWFLVGNEEQITLAANRLGWRVARLKHPAEGWTEIRLER